MEKKQERIIGYALVCILLGGFLAIIFAGYLLGLQWTGIPGKSLWDWMQLLIVPGVLALGGLLYTRVQEGRDETLADKRAQIEREIALDNQRESALQKYIDDMSQLLLHENLRGSEEVFEAHLIARARTLTILRRLDGVRKATVLKFLYEAGLLHREKKIVDLEGADLARIDLVEADLDYVNLSGANLTSADLTGASLNNALLDDANLSQAILKDADVKDARLEHAKLIRADLTNVRFNLADLKGADLTNADLKGVTLWRADLGEAKLAGARLTDANLMGSRLVYANLAGADLTNANLGTFLPPGSDKRFNKGLLPTGADLTNANLENANFEGADLREAIVSQEQLRATCGTPKFRPND